MPSLFPMLWNGAIGSSATAWLSRGQRAPAAARGASFPIELKALTNERPLRIELLEWEEARRRSDDWSGLIANSLEPNVFLEPAFALTSAQHSVPARRPVFLFVSDLSRGGDRGRLIGVCALTKPRGKFGTIARGWCSKLGALGTPLLDRVHGAEAFDLMLDWFSRNSPRTVGLLLPALPASGPIAGLIRARALARGLETRGFGNHLRAVLPAGGDAEALWRGTICQKRMKELRRQRRRLEDHGKLSWNCARSAGDVRYALERFLALEARGWKGGRGTALLCDPSVVTFARTMTRALSRQNQCRVDSLELDGEPIAMGITLVSGKSAALWKIAYDEKYASLSPGVQFTLEYTRRQLAEDSLNFTDSCAIADHPMIDKIWSERMPVLDIFISASSGRASEFHAAADREDLRRRARESAKRLYNNARGRSAVPVFKRPESGPGIGGVEPSP